MDDFDLQLLPLMNTFSPLNVLISVILDCFIILWFAVFQDDFFFGRRPLFIVKVPSSSWTGPKMSPQSPKNEKPGKIGNIGLGLTRPVSADTGGRVSLLFKLTRPWQGVTRLRMLPDTTHVTWHGWSCQATVFLHMSSLAWHGPCQVTRVAVSGLLYQGFLLICLPESRTDSFWSLWFFYLDLSDKNTVIPRIKSW